MRYENLFLVFCLTLGTLAASTADVLGQEPEKTITNPLGMEFVLLPAGSFLMGTDHCDDTRLCPENERPRHKVTFREPFYMGRTEVTQAQWIHMFGENPSESKGDSLPVENVSWDDANSFCKMIGARLPTEAEWEYAARSGSTSRYHCGGDDYGSCLKETAWYSDNSKGRTHPPGKKRANKWGLFDMIGNVYEWCSDKYDYKYYRNAPTTNPQGSNLKGAMRVYRGGSGAHYFAAARPSFRSSNFADYTNQWLGFRCAMSVDNNKH